jgi:hypothetical protein
MTTTAWIEAGVVMGIKVTGTVDTSTWDAMTMTWNAPTSDGKHYEMRIENDQNPGDAMLAKYSLSNALYGSAWKDNSEVTYWIQDMGAPDFTSVSEAAFLDSVSSNGTMALQTVNQWMQNLFVGYNFGLVGNTQTVSNLPAQNPLIGVTLNDMGSAGWADLKALIDVGALSTSDVPFFTLTDAESHPLYNQWAKVVFEHTQTAYGTQYSDMFQPLLALYTYQTHFDDNEYKQTVQDVLSWKVTILAPEPGVLGSVVAFAAVAGASRRRRRIAPRRDATPGSPARTR